MAAAPRRKKSAPRKKKQVRRKAAAKRELIAPRGSKRYVRRDRRGRIAESDDQGRSLSSDRRRKAKTRAKAGQGDKGDRGRAGRGTTGRARTGSGRAGRGRG